MATAPSRGSFARLRFGVDPPRERLRFGDASGLDQRLSFETEPMAALGGPDLVVARGKLAQRVEGAVRIAGERGFDVAGLQRIAPRRRAAGAATASSAAAAAAAAAGANPVPGSCQGGIELTQNGYRHGDSGVAAGPHGRDIRSRPHSNPRAIAGSSAIAMPVEHEIAAVR